LIFPHHRGHILKDLIKLEMTVSSLPWSPARRVEGGAQPTGDEWEDQPPMPEPDVSPSRQCSRLRDARMLRSFYPSLIHEDRNPLQVFIGLMRYAMHTLSFEESNDWQKKWALYTGAQCAAQIADRITRAGPLRVEAELAGLIKPGGHRV
jgi:hypothetical protein